LWQKQVKETKSWLNSLRVFPVWSLCVSFIFSHPSAWSKQIIFLMLKPLLQAVSSSKHTFNRALPRLPIEKVPQRAQASYYFGTLLTCQHQRAFAHPNQALNLTSGLCCYKHSFIGNYDVQSVMKLFRLFWTELIKIVTEYQIFDPSTLFIFMGNILSNIGHIVHYVLHIFQHWIVYHFHQPNFVYFEPIEQNLNCIFSN
jgi:hypothetical protein